MLVTFPVLESLTWPVGHMDSAGPEHVCRGGNFLWTVLLAMIP